MSLVSSPDGSNPGAPQLVTRLTMYMSQHTVSASPKGMSNILDHGPMFAGAKSYTGKLKFSCPIYHNGRITFKLGYNFQLG